MKKSLTAGLSALALAASAASVALIGGSTASHAAGEPSSAYGAELTIAGNEVIAADTIAVESTDGSLVTDSLAEVPGDPVVNIGLIEVLAENGHAKSTIASLGVGDGLIAELPPELGDALGEVCASLDPLLVEAGGELTGALNDALATLEGDLITPLVEALEEALRADALTGLNLGELLPEDLSGLCDALTGDLALLSAGVITAECNGDTGTSSVADLSSVLGLPIDVGSEPNRKLQLPAGTGDVIDLTLNRQTNNADGTFTVDALHLSLLGEIDLTLASATCGEVTRDTPEEPTDDPPSPTPVPTNLPVTG